MKRSHFMVIIAASLALAACGAPQQPAADEVPQVEEQTVPAPAPETPADAAAPADTTAAADTTASADATEADGAADHESAQH
jgi:hypothetical protein